MGNIVVTGWVWVVAVLVGGPLLIGCGVYLIGLFTGSPYDKAKKEEASQLVAQQ